MAVMERVRGAFARLRALCRGIRRAMMDYAYLMTLGAAIAVIAASAVYTRGVNERAHAQAAAQAMEIRETASPTPEPTPTAAWISATIRPVRLGGVTVRPVSGGVLRGYDAAAHVFWPALSCYKPHAALDMAGGAGEAVRCAMDGTVESASRDDLWGWRVTVAQTDGRRAVYAGLLLSHVREGQNVTRGQELGRLMDAIPAEAELGVHLHLELYDGGAACDPEEMLPEGA